jgi:hypothetical protein
MDGERGSSARLRSGGFIIHAPMLVAHGGDRPMGRALSRVGRPVARVADGLRHNRDRYKHIRQFQNVTRVTLRSDEQDG